MRTVRAAAGADRGSSRGAPLSVSPARQRHPVGLAARFVAVALVFVACRASLAPVPSHSAGQTTAPLTAMPTRGAFERTAYPSGGDAPCGEPVAPDSVHGPYTGEFRRIRAKDALTIVFDLCEPDAAFLAKLAAPAFGINDDGWLRNHVDRDGSGPAAIVSEPNGTGPYRLERWDAGTELSLARNDAYWGSPARNERAIIRWQDDAGERVDELRDGTVDAIDEVDTVGVVAVSDDVNLVLAPRAALNVAYLGFNNTFAPFDSDKVRLALAMGIDRQRILETAFPAGSELATHYAPCALPFGCEGQPWYEYDPILAKETLAAAGYPDGFETTIRYRAEPRPYLPDPTAVATELQAELEANLGIRAELVVEPEETFLADVDAGRLDGLHLLGQVADVPDVSAFLGPRFGPGSSAEFGSKYDDIAKALAAGGASADPRKRAAAYGRSNDAIRSHIPMIPLARTSTAAAYRGDVGSPVGSPLRVEPLATMTPGDRRQLVWLTSAEPAGLYCADEVDPVATLVCAQIQDTLYAYDPAGTEPLPSLAEACRPNPELTAWTCNLRSDVLFHDGSVLDANDVVLSFAVQWDRDHPLHRGREGGFARFAEWFGGFLNPAPATP